VPGFKAGRAVFIAQLVDRGQTRARHSRFHREQFWATDGGSAGAAAIAARMLLRHEVYDRSFYSEQLAPFPRVDDALVSIVRMVTSGGRLSEGYAAGISQMILQINRVTEAPLVSQRIYSSWGFHDIYELAREKAVILAALVPDNAVLPIRLSAEITQLLQEASKDDQAARRLQDYLTSIRTSLNAFDAARDGALLAALRSTRSTTTGLDQWRDTVRALIDACLDVLTEQRDERIRTATIDPNRLRDIAVAASKTGFDKATAGFPIGIFEEVAKTAEPLGTWTYTLKHARGELTNPLMGQPVSNEESFWAETMQTLAAAIVLHDVLAATALEEVRGDTPDEWWAAVKTAAAAIEDAGGKPIVLIAEMAAPVWLSEWRWATFDPGRRRPPADLRIERTTEHSLPGYAVHLNAIPVFQAPVEPTCSYVLPMGMLRRVEFTEFTAGQTVLVEFEDDPSDPWNGVLKVSLSRRVTLGDGKIVRVRFADEP
jgi:hypothetical protein